MKLRTLKILVVLAWALLFYVAVSPWVHATEPEGEMDYGRTCLALAMFSEARNQSYRGMLEVGAVVLRRVVDKDQRWPGSVCEVVQQPDQFHGVRDWHKGVHPMFIDRVKWDEAWKIADILLAATPEALDIISVCPGATHFSKTPSKDACKVEDHYFTK